MKKKIFIKFWFLSITCFVCFNFGLVQDKLVCSYLGLPSSESYFIILQTQINSFEIFLYTFLLWFELFQYFYVFSNLIKSNRTRMHHIKPFKCKKKCSDSANLINMLSIISCLIRFGSIVEENFRTWLYLNLKRIWDRKMKKIFKIEDIREN